MAQLNVTVDEHVLTAVDRLASATNCNVKRATRDELRYVLDPKDVMGADYHSETFRVLQNNETKKYGEYRTRRLVLAAYDTLVAEGMRPRTEGYR